jgi:hypothetical protein
MCISVGRLIAREYSALDQKTTSGWKRFDRTEEAGT